jgi:AcrR family transcriptional regulator
VPNLARPLTKNSDLTKARILASARQEFEANGILGLRVADVAERADCAVSLIYRYFIDRDGLLAQLLGDLYDEGSQINLDRAAIILNGDGPISVEDILNATTMPTTPDQLAFRAWRVQILAASTTNPALRARIEESTRNGRKVLEESIAHVKSRLPADTKFDDRVYTILLFNTFFIFNDLLGEDGVSDADYRNLLRDLLTR